MSESRTASDSPRWPTRMVIVASAGLALGAAALVARLAWIRARIQDTFYHVDPSSGYIVDQLPQDRRLIEMARMVESNANAVLWWTAFALVCVTLTIVGLRMADRQARLGLLRITAPLFGVVLLGLALGLLVHSQFEASLARVHALVSGAPLQSAPESCIPRLRVCSRAIAYESARKLTLMALVIPLTLVVFAARLGRGWSGAAKACFVVGLMVLLVTRAHRRDREHVLALCDPREQPYSVRVEPWPDLSSEDLQAVEAPRCGLELWPAQREVERGDRLALVAGYQLFSSGELAWLPRVGVGWDAVGLTTVDLHREIAAGISQESLVFGDEPTAVLALHVDARTPTAIMARYLRVMKAAGIDEVLLLGSGTAFGAFDSVGEWKRRRHCPVGLLRFVAELAVGPGPEAAQLAGRQDHWTTPSPQLGSTQTSATQLRPASHAPASHGQPSSSPKRSTKPAPPRT